MGNFYVHDDVRSDFNRAGIFFTNLIIIGCSGKPYIIVILVHCSFSRYPYRETHDACRQNFIKSVAANLLANYMFRRRG
jgi:hypothetical protein